MIDFFRRTDFFRRIAPEGGRLRRWGAVFGSWALFLLLPFAVLWRFAPIVSDTTIGNDYVIYPVDAQLEFVWAWRHGLVPLFVPGFAGGASASAMTLGQAWHPISWLCALTPGFGSGSAEVVVTFFRFLELGLAHRVLYRESRHAGLDRTSSFLLGFVTVFNGRMLDSFRYGSSLESYCGMLFAAAAFAAARRQGWSFGRVSWAAFTIYLTLVGGHPQWALFGVTGACLFAAGLLTRPSPGGQTFARLRFIGGVALSGLFGGLLSAGYLLPFVSEFMAENSARVGQDYGFTVGYSDSLHGTLSNLSRPLEADVHGAFGGSALPLVLFVSIPVALATLRKPLPIVLPAIAAMASLVFSMGQATPFHRWVVEHVPLFSSFRVPGRANLWVPPMLLLIGWTSLADLAQPALRRAWSKIPVVAWAGGLALIAHGVFQIVVPETRTSSYSPLLFSGGPYWVDTAIISLIAVAAAMFALTWTKRTKSRTTASIVCVLATVACAGIALPYGTWRAKRKATRTFAAMDEHHAKNLVFWGDPGFGMETKAVARAKEAKLPLERKSGALVEHWEVSKDDAQAVKVAAALPAGETVLSGDGVTAREGTGDAKGRVKPRAIHWNRWRFGVDAPEGGAFVFGQPKLPQWQATVDGRPATLVTANGTFPAVILEPGKHEVEVRFVSRAAIVGGALFFATLLAGAIVRHRLLAKGTLLQRLLTGALVLAILLGAGLCYRGLWPDLDVRAWGKKAAAGRVAKGAPPS